tara:strand:+ start:13247 stop:14731 length:1485 start_codon:yes stop_codon:yes gene_type:complete
MCFGGSDDDKSDKNSSEKDAAVDAELAKKGYSSTYKGVTGAVDSKGQPIQSGAYAQAKQTASDNYDNKVAYEAAYKSAKTDWDASNVGLPVIDQDLINVGMGKGGYLLEGFSPTNAEVGYGPPTPDDQKAATEMLGKLMRQKYDGGTTYSFPGSDFNDPLGNALGSTLNETYEGSGYNNRVNQSSFDALAKAYNQPFQRNLASDAAGNVGTNTFGQRVATGFGNLVEGLVLGQVLGPVGSILGTGTNYEMMNTYGPRVPGWEGTASTASFDYTNALGGALGDFAADKAVPVVAQGIYDKTGSVGQATAGAVATGVGLTEGIGSYVGSRMQDVRPGIMSSDIKSPYEARTEQEKEVGGFGASLSGAPNNSSAATPSQNVTPAISTMQNTGLSDTSGDVAAGTPDFDWQAWLLANAENANPNTAQPTNLIGSPAISASNNPLFDAQPDMKGVRYLQQSGTNRNYGTAMMQPVNSLQQSNSRRRTGLNDRRVGVVIG